MTAISERIASERVAKGVALLDEHKPGWADRINAARLAVLSPCDCILGQLYPPNAEGVDGYFLALADHDLPVWSYDDAKEHGFAGGDTGGGERLDAEWVRVITERRPAA